MAFYRDHVVPWLIHLAMKNRDIGARRARVVPPAAGRVLEIGVGSGLNLPFYRRAQRVVGVDPSTKLLSLARKSAEQAPCPVELIEGTAERLPFAEGSFDTVLTTCTLCSIPDAVQALGEMRRVLRPGGRLIFLEHGHAPDAAVARWQDRIDPVWTRIAGGCHINRRVADLIAGAGFRIAALKNEYAPGPKPWTYLYEGTATRE